MLSTNFFMKCKWRYATLYWAKVRFCYTKEVGVCFTGSFLIGSEYASTSFTSSFLIGNEYVSTSFQLTNILEFSKREFTITCVIIVDSLMLNWNNMK